MSDRREPPQPEQQDPVNFYVMWFFKTETVFSSISAMLWAEDDAQVYGYIAGKGKSGEKKGIHSS